MKIIDPGHAYALAVLDGNGYEFLKFVKRVGAKYPGNEWPHPGTNIQEVLRVLIDRIQFLDSQQPELQHNWRAVEHLRAALRHMEYRAAEKHNRRYPVLINRVETMVTCGKCGHIGCNDPAISPVETISIEAGR